MKNRVWTMLPLPNNLELREANNMNYNGADNERYNEVYGQMWKAQYAALRPSKKEHYDGMNGIWYEFDFSVLEEKVAAILVEECAWDTP
jgi:hypothetical protein